MNAPAATSLADLQDFWTCVRNDPQLSAESDNALKAGDFMPALFDWYCHIGLTAHLVANLHRASDGFKVHDPLEWAVLRGLLHRCSRLMLSNVALTHEGLFGETAKIIDRCIFETSVKLRWLCKTGKMDLYLRASLKPELAFRSRILHDIENQNSPPTPLQDRLLKSIERHRALAGVNWDQVKSSPVLPPLDQMIDAVGLDPLIYLIGQRIGSHPVHGSWSALLDDYIHVDGNGEFSLTDHEVEPRPPQYLGGGIHAIDGSIALVKHAFGDTGDTVLEALKRKRANFIEFYQTYASP
jgi:hypothetical protein